MGIFKLGFIQRVFIFMIVNDIISILNEKNTKPNIEPLKTNLIIVDDKIADIVFYPLLEVGFRYEIYIYEVNSAFVLVISYQKIDTNTYVSINESETGKYKNNRYVMIPDDYIIIDDEIEFTLKYGRGFTDKDFLKYNSEQFYENLTQELKKL